MQTPHVLAVSCAAALNRVGGMPFRWSLNPYRGCQHGCHYCFARRTHGFLELNPDDDFSGVVLAKINLPQVLRHELSARSWRRERVALGTATDPYQPVEGRYRLTRGCLETLRDFRTPCTVVTKGTLVVRDLDLLRAMDAHVCISLPTVDAWIWRRLEPGTPHPRQRLRALRRLADAGVHAGVLVAPLLPGLTTGPEQVEAVVRAAAECGARFAGGGVLYLKPGVKEHYLAFLAREFPSLLESYRRLYPGAYAPREVQAGLRGRVAEASLACGLTAEGRPGPRQLELEV